MTVLLTPSIGMASMGFMHGMGMMGGGMGGGPGGQGATPTEGVATSTSSPSAEMNEPPEGSLRPLIPPSDATEHTSVASEQKTVAGEAAQSNSDKLGSPDAVAVLQSPTAKTNAEKAKPPKNKPGEITVSTDPDSNMSLTVSTAGVGRPIMNGIGGGAMAGGPPPTGGGTPMGPGMGMMGASGMPIMISSGV